MKLSGPQIISGLRDKLPVGVGRHLYAVLGSYAGLADFEEAHLGPARFVPHESPQVVIADAIQERAVQVQGRGKGQSLPVARLPQVGFLEVSQPGIAAEHGIEVPPDVDRQLVP